MNAVQAHSDLVNRLAHTRVLVVGDLMLDRYYWGDVRRISPEAPVPIVNVNDKSFTLGGAGNVAANLAGLGCPVGVVAVLGRDPEADQVRALMTDHQIDDHCVVDQNRPTITKTRIMAGKQQVVRLDEEDRREVAAPIKDRLRDALNARLETAKAVIVSDYGKGMFSAAQWTQSLIRACRRRSIPVFIDPKGTHWERYAGATCITPNTAELELVIGTRISETFDLAPVARDLCRRLSLERLLVTRGPRGMSLFGPRNEAVNIAARAREVFDVSGAGDTVIATLAACVAAGMPFSEAATVANAAAGIVVGKLGTQPVNVAELAAVLENAWPQRSASPLWKVTDVEDAAARIARWRQMDQRIVFTNGCFDLLHPGHVSLIHQARQLGDRLIIGLNTDDSIRRLKGDQRPILSGQDRAAILSALTDVDMVVFFAQDTPLELIAALRPDILVKGADYPLEAVVGRELVTSYGGRVCLVELLDGYSTSALAGRLAGKGDQQGARNGHQSGTA